LLESMPST